MACLLVVTSTKLSTIRQDTVAIASTALAILKESTAKNVFQATTNLENFISVQSANAILQDHILKNVTTKVNVIVSLE